MQGIELVEIPSNSVMGVMFHLFPTSIVGAVEHSPEQENPMNLWTSVGLGGST